MIRSLWRDARFTEPLPMWAWIVETATERILIDAGACPGAGGGVTRTVFEISPEQALVRARRALTWRGPALMLVARPAIAILTQAIVAVIFVVRSSPTPWHDTEPWLPVYGTLVDAGCLALLWGLTRREGIRVFDLVSFDRNTLGRDIALGVVLIAPSLVFIFGGTYAAGWLVYGSPSQPYYFGRLPLLAALYGGLIWPLIWALVEQMTYNGYVLPRVRMLSGNTVLAIIVVSFFWALQHAFMPLTFDARFMAFRWLSSVPYSSFLTVLYLRLRRLLPLAITHALLDGASVWISALLPVLRAG